ncbi:MAG: radical SAM protein [Candidatus Adiutrix sp.]|jgi:nitrogen fixation protein NifB|nr:radical SAM protein [Candidatus Adiutrix sp.]
MKNHPCFSGECRPTTGRIHLPVSPSCNIRCRFCARGLSPDLARPGQAAKLVTPREAMGILDRAMLICPDLKVAGVAGPGDPLASPHAVETLGLIHQKYPQLINCLSTNGLALADYLPALMAAGVQSLTVTVNAVDPGILTQLCAGIVWEGADLGGYEGCAFLIASQREGIRRARASGLNIKINMVVAPEINGRHVGQVARAAADWGAAFINLIPLLPAGELSGAARPGPEYMEEANEVAGRHLPPLRHCRRCRADACGVPGQSDFARELYQDWGPVETFSHG